MSTYRLHIEGRVQGVGFRPFIFNQAIKHSLTGNVSNGSDGVWIDVCGAEDNIRGFIDVISKNPPKQAIITGFTVNKIENRHFDQFQIIGSAEGKRGKLQISPDFGICEDCRREIHKTANRRYEYPFITCTNCGPRYSIMRDLPYDRERTSMEPFTLCNSCSSEYNDPGDRRFYSQTNSCPECPVELFITGADGQQIKTDQPVIFAANAVLDGKIIAVKGVGGYLLIADSTNKDVIEVLRRRKRRPNKPFALMYPSMESIEDDLNLTAPAKKLLSSPESPIVLLNAKKKQLSGMLKADIAPGLHKIGVMLPYAPLLEIMIQKIGPPVIATSANLSSDPIIFNSESASEDLGTIADLFVHHNREIIFPQDDSVVNINLNSNIIINRRSRGYSPSFYNNILAEVPPALAMGADMKSAFAIQHLGNTYISQYLGDLELLQSQQRFDLVLDRLTSLLQFKPQLILTDQHPGYFSVQKGFELARQSNAVLMSFQHHKAHFASVLAENRLLDEDNILGVIWDGLGYGEDNEIWGGEFFNYTKRDMQRVSHLPDFPLIGGNKMSRDPRLSAFSILNSISEEDRVHQLFDTREFDIYSSIAENSSLFTSSMGRVFDAVAALLIPGIQNTFEGEAGMKLEALAAEYAGSSLSRPEFSLKTDITSNYTAEWLLQIMAGLRDGISAPEIACAFHFAMVDLIKVIASVNGFTKIAFSGGVFQNSLLGDLILNEMKNDFSLYFHKELSPNDECIAFGQLAMYKLQNDKKMQLSNLETETC